MDQIIAELRKIPPVTRFLCASSLVVTLPVLLNMLPIYKVIFIPVLIRKKLEVWRLFTTFFFGGRGIGYVFGLFMLYRNSDDLENTRYSRRSADYAWQLLLTASAIILFNLPISSVIHSRAFILALTYLHAYLSPLGAQSSLFGMISFPITYLPYVLLAIDFLNDGPSAVASGVTGLVAGHLWWWGIWGGPRAAARGDRGYAGKFGEWGNAPSWIRNLFGENPSPPAGRTAGGPYRRGPVEVHEGFGGVQVTPPRATLLRTGSGNASETISNAHRWGSGTRLGNR